MNLKTIQDLEEQDLLKNAKVLLRLDLNVPMQNGNITDNTRIKAALPTLKKLIEHNAKIVILSHLGRPKGNGFDKKYSLEAVGVELAELLGKDLVLSEIDGLSPSFVVERLQKNQILLMENLRFSSSEKDNQQEFVQFLADSMDIYINDAFGTCHRSHASTVGLPKAFSPEKIAAGLLIQKEVTALEDLMKSPRAPFTLLLGGAKVSDKIGVILNLMNHCNRILIGGAMAYTFLKYNNVSTGSSKVEEDKMNVIERIYENAKLRKVEIFLPSDHIVASEFNSSAKPIVTKDAGIDGDFMGLDIGPKTLTQYQTLLLSSETIFWNGPMGVCEWEAFSKGTTGVANAIAESSAKSVAGGGDSIAVIAQCNLNEHFSHISTGGGASLEFLEGNILPGLAALKK